jgi:hypothetical protein
MRFTIRQEAKGKDRAFADILSDRLLPIVARLNELLMLCIDQNPQSFSTQTMLHIISVFTFPVNEHIGGAASIGKETAGLPARSRPASLRTLCVGAG